MGRSFRAIAIASTASAAIATIVLFAADAWDGDGGTDANLLPFMLFWWFVFAALANMIAAATLGLAWRRLAEAKQWRAAWHYVAPAIFVGFVIPFLLTNGGVLLALRFDLVANWFPNFLLLYVYGAALGGLTAMFTWLIRRPDRDAQPNPPTSAP